MRVDGLERRPGLETRSGLCRLRHLETHTLWFQDNVLMGAIADRKVRGDVNPADLFIRHFLVRKMSTG